MKILVVDDETTILETVEHKLRKEGFTVFTAESAEAGLNLARRVKPDLLVLDVMLPQRSGLELARALRRDQDTPIIFLTAKAAEDDRLSGLEVGDDYMTKPFSLAELVARIKSILRRVSGGTANEIVELSDLRIDPRTHEVLVRGEKASFSPKEFALLYFLARHRGQVFSREALLDRVWGQDTYVSPRTVDVHIRWLREHIEESASNPQRLITVRGVGYKFLG